MIEQEVNYKPLLILNASAGSGKTFNLVRYYLKLVLRTENPVPVSKILAMTFTNKASNEMKSRIMGELFKIAYAEKTQNPTFQTNLERIANDLNEDPKSIGRNARSVLKSILHQYEDFNVLTIDKFNLRLIRSFSRDLNLSEHFEVVLNEKELLEKAVDELLSSISDRNKNEVYYHAIEYAKSSLDEEKDWQIRKELIDSARLLQKEAFREEVEKLSASKFNKELKETWKIQLSVIYSEFKALQEKTRKLLSQFTETDFAGKSTTFKGINKLISELSDREFHSAKIELSEASLKNIVKSSICDYDKNQILQANLDVIEIQKKASTLNLFLKNFHIMGVLSELSKRMKEICEQEGVVLISDFNQLVGNLINDEDAPFIYERIGNRFGHFFLDEFQDTSRLQWLNMLPLLHHSLSENQFSLIVGDPKQSIYRFKNGIAEQFVALPKIYNPEKNPVIEGRSLWFESQGKVEALEQNWRSSKEIVHFNNSFFEEIISNTDLVPEKGKSFYSSISQEPKGEDGGYVEVQLFDKSSYSNDSVEIELLINWVESCLKDGFEMSDLCVLGAKTSQCNQYASALKNKGYDVISADSLLLPSDQYVQLTIDFLKCFANLSVEQRFKLFSERFLRHKFKNKGSEIYLNCFEFIEDKKIFVVEKFFQLSGLNKSLFSFNYPDIYTLIKEFFRAVDLSESRNAYLQQLLDFAHDFDKRNGPELTEFIAYYESRGKNTNVDFVSDSNAITVMTAHKSKGLEFPVVFIPNTDFFFSKSRGKYLTEIEGNIVQSSYSKDSKIEKIAHETAEENESKLIDGINLTYVAYTRPIYRLYIAGIKDNEKLMKLLSAGFENTMKSELIGHKDAIFSRYKGDKSTHIRISEKKLTDSFLAKNLEDVLWFPEISLLSAIDQEESEPSEERKLGILFHHIMELSQNNEDAIDELERIHLEGQITFENKKQLENWLINAFSNRELQDVLLCGSSISERTLIVDELKRLRPDKLIISDRKCFVIDFKTGERLQKHKKQVLEYMKVLKQMDFDEICGFLYYAETSELEKVEV